MHIIYFFKYSHVQYQRVERARAVSKWMKALGFWERSITKKILRCWKHELELSRLRLARAVVFRNRTLARKVLLAWKYVPVKKQRLLVCY